MESKCFRVKRGYRKEHGLCIKNCNLRLSFSFQFFTFVGGYELCKFKANYLCFSQCNQIFFLIYCYMYSDILCYFIFQNMNNYFYRLYIILVNN